jgi:hypothetical protein
VALAKALGARVTGLYVVVGSQVAAGTEKAARPVEDEAVGAAEEFVRAVPDEAKRHDVPHKAFYARADSPYEAIIGTAEAKGCAT